MTNKQISPFIGSENAGRCGFAMPSHRFMLRSPAHVLIVAQKGVIYMEWLLSSNQNVKQVGFNQRCTLGEMK